MVPLGYLLCISGVIVLSWVIDMANVTNINPEVKSFFETGGLTKTKELVGTGTLTRHEEASAARKSIGAAKAVDFSETGKVTRIEE